MRKISTAIAATLVLATTALAVEMANHKNSNAQVGAKVAAPAAAKESSRIIEIWSQDSPSLDDEKPDAETQASENAEARESEVQHADVRDSQSQNSKEAVANERNAKDLAAATAESAETDAQIPVAGSNEAKTSSAAEANANKAASAEPEIASGKAAAEPPAAAEKPRATGKPRHARRGASRSHHARSEARSFGAGSSSESAVWRTGGGAYRFSGSFGGCQYRGSVSASGYHIDRTC
jgi:hypothetical protein